MTAERASMAVGWRALLAAVWLTVAPGAWAHHSGAMFDSTHTVSLLGTVKAFQMTNPHTWLQLVVTDPASGAMVEWSIEFGSVGMLARGGFRPTTFNPGDKVTIECNPLKNGSPGCNFMTATLADGTKLGGGPPGALPGEPLPAAASGQGPQ